MQLALSGVYVRVCACRSVIPRVDLERRVVGDDAGLPWVQHAAWLITHRTIVAQAFCWHGILALKHITEAVESLRWAAGFSWLAALPAMIAMDTGGLVHALAMPALARRCLYGLQ